MKRLWLGLVLIALCSAGLLLGDSTRQRDSGRATKKWRIHLLELITVADTEEMERGIRTGLRDAGLVENTDYTFTVRCAQGDMPTLPTLVDAALNEGADLLMTFSTPTLQTALQRAAHVPIVFTFVADPLLAGAGKSYTDHLPNVTGVPTTAAYEEAVALMRECLPTARRIGTLFAPAEVNSVYTKARLAEFCAQYGFELLAVPVNSTAEVSDAVLSLLSSGIDAILQGGSNLTSSAFASITEPARRAGTPVFGFLSSDLKNGAVVVPARDYFDAGHKAAAMAVRIIRGANPATIPFEPLTRTRVMVNLNAARAVGLTVPKSILERAEHVIKEGGA